MPYKDPEKRRAYGRAAAKRYREKHPERVRAATKRWELANPEMMRAKANRQLTKDPDYGRRWWYMSRYGITLEQRAELLEEQDGLCAICLEQPAEHIDHDAITGRVRGALCGSCNRALGLLRDKPDLARECANYLETERVFA